jgi:hypothetical protein
MAWQVASASTAVQAAGIVATSAGQHTLKGITRSTELFSCTAVLRPDAGECEEVSALECIAPLPFTPTSEPDVNTLLHGFQRPHRSL